MPAARAVNLTVNGRKDQIRYQRRYPIEPIAERAQGIDLAKPQYFAALRRVDQEGWHREVDAGQARRRDAHLVGCFVRDADEGAERRPVHLLTRDDDRAQRLLRHRCDVWRTDSASPISVRRCRASPWTEGVTLVNYTSDKGDKLQAALFLPANYEKGKAYPTIVNIYEKMSQGANQFANPTANGFNRSVYTSNGYAVLLPDITYKRQRSGHVGGVVRGPGAARRRSRPASSIRRSVGLTGHSWGGYQTSFLVTQTDIFAAAVAGAPLTNMISMYSLIYKNTGGGNGAIFEASQGRFKGGYWDNWDAYYRNSPVFFAKNVKTPLMILHNDQDGAVDFTQGVEYYNTLRRLQKPVIMLEYIGENHGLRKPSNSGTTRCA